MRVLTQVDDDSKSDQGRALRTFRGSYLGGVTSNPTDIAIIGASFEEGYGTTLMANGWTNVFRDVLRAYAQPKGVAGGGSVPASNSTYQAGVGNYYGFNPAAPFGGGTYADDPQIATSGTFTAVPTIGLGLRSILAANGASKTFEFYGTGADVIYTQIANYGTFTWAVDGGSATSVNTAGSTAYAQRVQIRGLTRGRHTITLTCTSAGTANTGVVWEGLAFYDGDESAGIRVWQASHSGYGPQNFVTGTGNPYWVNSFTTWNFPDLVIFNLGYNDWKNGRTAAQIKADLQTMIQYVKDRATTLALPTPSMVIMSSFAVTVAGSAHVEPWANVVEAFKQIAQADDEVCLLDYQHWFGRASETSQSTRGGILVSDGLHPTDSGAAIIGGGVAEFVLDSSERMRDLIRSPQMDLLQVELRTEYSTTQPASPAAGVKLFTRNRARRLPAFVGPAGQDSQLQPAFFTNRVARVTPVPGAAAPAAEGITLTNVNAPTAVTPSAPNGANGLGGSVARHRYSTSTTIAGSGLGWRATTNPFFITAVANAGGFFLVWRFGQMVSVGRLFVGLMQSTGAVPAGTDPLGSITQAIGFGKNQADANIKAFSVAATGGTNTNVDTGIPWNTTASLYEARLFCPSGGSTWVDWSLHELSAGTFAQGRLATNLPALNTAMYPHFDGSNGTNIATASIDFQSFYAETDN